MLEINKKIFTNFLKKLAHAIFNLAFIRGLN